LKLFKRILTVLLWGSFVFVVGVAFLGYVNENDKSVEVLNSKLQFQTNNKFLCTEDREHKGKSIYVIGKTAGIYVNTKGILVIDTGEVEDKNGSIHQPAKNKLIPGDYIISVNDITVKTKKQLIQMITDCKGQNLCFKVMRKEKELMVNVMPVLSIDGNYKVGIWVRDDLQGLGTITYIDGNRYGALGHSINDIDTGELLDVSGGQLYTANIFGVKRGEKGNPGVIEGMITYDDSYVLGTIDHNSKYGIYGEIDDLYLDDYKGTEKRQIGIPNIGEAAIQSYINGECKEYAIQIVDLKRNKCKDMEMEIKITDPELLKLTGGIIQGMFTSYNGSNT